MADSFEDLLSRGIVIKDVTYSLQIGEGNAQLYSRSGARITALLECKGFYSIQSRHTLGEEKERVDVPIYITDSVREEWIPFLKSAISQINEACPGVYLYQADESTAKIVIYGGCDGCYTKGEILSKPSQQTHITLDHAWSRRKRTSVHELLHALGAQHEHQAAGAEKFVHNKCPRGQGDYDQYKPNSSFHKVTRRDPLSIMMYEEGIRRNCQGGDPVWGLKPPGEPNDEISELDKVGLNQLYCPCRSAAYNPLRSSDTGMWYCGRWVMQNHNRPAKNVTDGHCGPKFGANCPACRSLKNPTVEGFVSKGCWQGWSGLIYCGEYFGQQELGHDGYCGPNNGPPCPECKRLLS